MREHSTTPVLTDVFLTGSAARAEHYEIAAYTSLIEQARALGERDSVKLLQANLKQEKDAAKKVETISKRILKKATPSARSNGAPKRRSTSASSTRSRSSSSARSTSGTRRTASRARS